MEATMIARGLAWAAAGAAARRGGLASGRSASLMLARSAAAAGLVAAIGVAGGEWTGVLWVPVDALACWLGMGAAPVASWAVARVHALACLRLPRLALPRPERAPGAEELRQAR